MIRLDEVGASVLRDAAGQLQLDAGGRPQVRFGVYLPGITFPKGYRLQIRVIHEDDQFTRGIEPRDLWLSWKDGTELDLWETTISLTTGGAGRFGDMGRYLYRFQLFRADGRAATFWFADPFGRDSGLGTVSAFELQAAAPAFAWTDAAFHVPEVDEMVVYELHVAEFNRTFDGVVRQLDYLSGLGVNVLELMPITNVKEDVEWGYTPLGYFSPDERLGGPAGMRRLVDACHARGIAVILDAVYAHAHPEFAFNLVYDTSREPNPMMGPFEGEFFLRPGTDYGKAFTRDYFFEVNRYWLEQYHVDGFRYDYVPGMYDGPRGDGYAALVHRTYQHSTAMGGRFLAPNGRSRIIQCAEHLPDPRGILSTTYSNCAWQNALLDKARDMARWSYVDASFAHQLDPELIGYPSEYVNPAEGDSFPVAPFQYLESHDHPRFIREFGRLDLADLLGEAYGDRERFFKTQPYVIALYTARGIPMLWQGQEFGENGGLPGGGFGRVLYARPLHWEYFYDATGKALVRLYRIMGALRRQHRALGSRGYFFYYNDANHLSQGVIVFRRHAPAEGGSPTETLVVALNFSDRDATAWIEWPEAGAWVERIDGVRPPLVVPQAGDWLPVPVPSNYGAVYLR